MLLEEEEDMMPGLENLTGINTKQEQRRNLRCGGQNIREYI
jgi:hypothetical protein